MKGKMNKLHLVGASLGMALLAGPYAYAQPVNGPLDPVSSAAEITLSLVLGEVVRVSFPDGDIDFVYTPGDDIELTHEFCVYSNQSSVDLDLLVALTNQPGNPTDVPVLLSGADEIPYSLALRRLGDVQISAPADDIRQEGITIASEGSANTSSDLCAVGGNTHEFQVTILDADIAVAPGGNYTDAIEVTVELN